MGFPAVGLVAVVDLGSGFLGLYVFLVAVTVACLGDWKTDWKEGFGFGEELFP